jgi:hypothetical protein
MPRAPGFLLLLLLTSAFSGLEGQETGAGTAGTRAVLPRDEEIALARSAAPPAFGRNARVMVFTGTSYIVAEAGTSGVACYVGRSWPESLEPHCFDPEGAETILPIEIRRVELRAAGKDSAEVDRDIAAGLATGRFRLPRRPALSYMLSSGQRLISDDGKPVGSWRPHIMIYYPYLTAADVALEGDPDLRGAVLVDAGRPTANLMIVVPKFIDPEPRPARP